MTERIAGYFIVDVPEKQVKEEIKKICKRHGAYYTMTVPMGMGRKGILDFVICHQGWYIAVEAKRGKVTKPTVHQAREMKKIKDAGGLAAVINAETLHEIADLLTEITQMGGIGR